MKVMDNFVITITEETDEYSNDDIQPLTRSNAVLNLEKLPADELNEAYEQLVKAQAKYHEKVMSILKYKGVILTDVSHIERNPDLYHTLLPEILAGKVIHINPTEGKRAWVEFETDE
jgi:hypothetical protein